MTGRNINRGKIPSELGWLADWMSDVNSRLKGLEAPTAADKKNTLAVLEKTVEDLIAMQTVVQSAVALSNTGSTGYYTSPTSVALTAPSGRIEIQYGGSLNGGGGYFVFQVERVDDGTVLIARDTIRTDPAKRVAVTGGVSFSPSGYRLEAVDVPANVPVRVRLQIYAENTTTYFLGGSISARVSA